MIFLEGAALSVVKFEINKGLLGSVVEYIMSYSEYQIGRNESTSALAKIRLIFEFECECSDVPVNGQMHFFLWNYI